MTLASVFLNTTTYCRTIPWQIKTEVWISMYLIKHNFSTIWLNHYPVLNNHLLCCRVRWPVGFFLGLSVEAWSGLSPCWALNKGVSKGILILFCQYQYFRTPDIRNPSHWLTNLKRHYYCVVGCWVGWLDLSKIWLNLSKKLLYITPLLTPIMRF